MSVLIEAVEKGYLSFAHDLRTDGFTPAEKIEAAVQKGTRTYFDRLCNFSRIFTGQGVFAPDPVSFAIDAAILARDNGYVLPADVSKRLRDCNYVIGPKPEEKKSSNPSPKTDRKS